VNDALFIAATGMQAQQTSVDTIANNIVNANTAGFKRSKVTFTDMVTKQALPVAATAPDALLSPGAHVGMGVALMNVNPQFEAGELKKTGSPFDLAISGDGFIEV
jgi:flagellar basal-body rod protein FlgG